MRRRRATRPPRDVPGAARVLIVSASMGAGHDGAARNLAEQLRLAGHEAEVRDFLDSGPMRIGSALRRGYEFELRHVPLAYDATYRLWYRVPWLCPLVAWLVTVLTRRRVLRWVRELHADVVVSTYPLSTLCLGRLRRRGALSVPVVNFITDFGVHPLWVHRGADLNLAVHDTPAQAAARRTGRWTVACGPAVSARFDAGRRPSRGEARSRFGIADDQRAVLVVAGSWGVGNLRDTWDAIASDGRFLPVVVCGRDERLREQVAEMAAAAGRLSLVLGWTDEMPALMAACDALVENAGGLTSLEAMCAGLPVVSFDPIAGHGRENTAAMQAAGVGRLAPTVAALQQALAELTQPGPARHTQIAEAQAMFRRSPADLVLEAAAIRPEAVAARRRATAPRLVTGAAAISAFAWCGLTTGVAVATEAGAGVAHPARHSGSVVYVGVRLTAAQLADPAVVYQLQRVRATAVVDDVTAQAAGAAIRALVTSGVSMANGGVGEAPVGQEGDAPWTRARRDARAVRDISAIAAAPVTFTVPGRRLTAWDLLECKNAHTALVVPNHIFRVDASSPLRPVHLTAKGIYVVNGLAATPAQLAYFLADFQASLGGAQLVAAPLATLA